MTQREKVYRDFVKMVARADYDINWYHEAKEVLAAADAIPDAPVCDTCNGRMWIRKISGDVSCPDCESKPVPSRAELIGLMCNTYLPDQFGNWAGTVTYVSMTRVLDALIKAGAIKL